MNECKNLCSCNFGVKCINWHKRNAPQDKRTKVMNKETGEWEELMSGKPDSKPRVYEIPMTKTVNGWTEGKTIQCVELSEYSKLAEELDAEKFVHSTTNVAFEVLKKENSRLREALEFYADPKSHWMRHDSDDGFINRTELDIDLGKRAREALKK